MNKEIKNSEELHEELSELLYGHSSAKTNEIYEEVAFLRDLSQAKDCVNNDLLVSRFRKLRDSFQEHYEDIEILL